MSEGTGVLVDVVVVAIGVFAGLFLYSYLKGSQGTGMGS